MRILFTGVTSFSGQVFFNELKKRGHDVIGVSSRTREYGCQADFSQESFEWSIPEGYFDTLIHFASYVPISEKESSWTECMPVNINGTIGLLSALEGRVGRILLASSCAVYGAKKLSQPVTENHPLQPDTAYALTKYAQEQIVQAYCRSRNIPYAAMRLGYVYGPGMNSDRAIIKFIEAIQSDKEINLVNARGAGLHLIHVDDIANIGQVLLGEGYGNYNVVMPRHISLLEFVKTAAQVIGKNANIKEVDKGLEYQVSNHYDVSRLNKIGILPQKSLEDGIQSLLKGIL